MSVGAVSGGQAKRLAVTVPVACAVLAFVASVSGQAEDINMPRVLAGTLVLAVLLALMAEAAPSIAAGFAWLILVTALFVTGEPAWTALANVTGGPRSGGGVKDASRSAGARVGQAGMNKAAEAVAIATTNIDTRK